MPTALTFLNFSVVLDNSGATPVLRVIDTSVYPVDITSITGYITATQPDGTTVTLADAVTLGHQATAYTNALRLASDGSFQNGTYTFTLYLFTVVGGSYDIGGVTKSFELEYARPTAVLTQAVNQFTPSVVVYDNTNYSQTGLQTNSVSRLWNAQVSGVGTIVDAVTAVLDCAITSTYYDAVYDVQSEFFVGYLVLDDSWATVLDKVTGSVSFDVYPARSLNILLADINAYKAAMFASNASACSDEEDLTCEMLCLFELFKANGLCGYTQYQYNLYSKLLSLLDISTTTHTYGALDAYSFSDYCGYFNGVGPGFSILGTPVVSLSVLSQSSISITWDIVTNATEYYVQWSTASDFSTIVGSSTVYHPTNLVYALALQPATLYYVRVQASAVGFTDSLWGTASATTNALTATAMLYWGSAVSNATLTNFDILAGTVQTFIPGANKIDIDMRASGTTPLYYWFAQRVTEGVKTLWYENVGNEGPIDPTNLWGVQGTVVSGSVLGDWRVYMVNYATYFPLSQNVLQFID